MRLFFALRPDPTTRVLLHRRAVMMQRYCGGRVLPAPSLHLTVGFLGEVPGERIASLVGLTSAEPIQPGVLTFGHVGSFSRRRILWAGLGPGRSSPDSTIGDMPVLEDVKHAVDEAEEGVDAVASDGGDLLRELHTGLLARLAPLGMVVRPKPFRPHVSLVRNVSAPELSRSPLAAVIWPYDALSLMASEPGGRHRYLELARSPLNDDFSKRGAA